MTSIMHDDEIIDLRYRQHRMHIHDRRRVGSITDRQC
jgi:hypothetical protein